jgi:ferredoxin
MSAKPNRLLICNCEKTMQFDADQIGQAAGFSRTDSFSNLCRRELPAFEQALTSGDGICVTCTQESALFSEVAVEAGQEEPAFVNIRERAGWTSDKSALEPKMAALLAANAINGTSRLKTIESDGLCLVIGAGQQAFDTARMLDRTLSVTLLLTGGADDILLPEQLAFPVFSGVVSQATGSLGAYELEVNQYAAMRVSSRQQPQFGMPRNGAKTNCSVIFDMSGIPPLFARAHGRDGYVRVDAGDPLAVMRAAIDASDLVGSFEKPIYVKYDREICAHSRSKKTGCTKCLNACPAGAIQPDGDGVAIDAGICGGCGNCAAHCPTGAVNFDYPTRRVSLSRIQELARVFLAAGGTKPVLLVHDEDHGALLINAMARTGRGLPAHVIAYSMHATSGIGHDALITALVAGFRNVMVLMDPRKQAEYAALRSEIELTNALVAAAGAEGSRVQLNDETDPDKLEATLWAHSPSPEIKRKTYAPVGGKREVARAAITLLLDGRADTHPIALPASAPYGKIAINKDACTLCMACVSACPADAIRDNPEMPQLRFVESACVQCGICAATCPESAITLEPRYNPGQSAMQPLTLHEDEPAQCTRCSKPFASKKMLDRVAETLGGKHWMFLDDDRIALLHMCESCRLEALSEGGADPFAIAQRKRVRTTDDYVAAGKAGLSVDDFFDAE